MAKRSMVLACGLAALLVLPGCDGQDAETERETAEAEPVSSESVHWPPAVVGELEVAHDPLVASYLILLDNSGSMNDRECSGNLSKFDVARAAVAEFAESLPSSDNIALAVFFGSTARLVVPFGSAAAQNEAFTKELGSLIANEGTPLRGAIAASYEDVTRQAQAQLGYGTHRLVIVTDGDSSDGDPAGLVQNIVRTSRVELHVIGFCTGSGHSLNVPGYTRYYTADDPTALAEGLVAVRAETATFDAVSTFDE